MKLLPRVVCCPLVALLCLSPAVASMRGLSIASARSDVRIPGARVARPGKRLAPALFRAFGCNEYPVQHQAEKDGEQAEGQYFR